MKPIDTGSGIEFVENPDDENRGVFIEEPIHPFSDIKEHPIPNPIIKHQKKSNL